jgi:hypothetical protein
MQDWTIDYLYIYEVVVLIKYLSYSSAQKDITLGLRSSLSLNIVLAFARTW